MARSSAIGHRFTNRVAGSVPKFNETYRSVQPAIGTSGPSSRSMRSASESDFGSSSVRLVINPCIRLIPSFDYHEDTEITKVTTIRFFHLRGLRDLRDFV